MDLNISSTKNDKYLSEPIFLIEVKGLIKNNASGFL